MSLTHVEHNAPQALGALPLLDQYLAFADKIARTEFVPKEMRGKPDTILACLAKGYEVGLSPMQSLDSINVIDGRPGLKPEAMRALVVQGGHSFRIPENTPTRCTIAVRRREWPDGEWEKFTWTIDDAKRAGLADKQVWKSYPKAMLLARVTSEACRAVFPDVVKGLSYTPDELDGLGGAQPMLATPTPTRECIWQRIQEWKADGRSEWVQAAGEWWEAHRAGLAWRDMPEDLAETFLAEIDRIEGIGAPTDPDDGPGGGSPFDGAIPATATDAEPTYAPGEEPFTDPAPADEMAKARAKRTPDRWSPSQFHRVAGGAGFGEEDRRTLIFVASDGATTSAAEAFADEAVRDLAWKALGDVRAGGEEWMARYRARAAEMAAGVHPAGGAAS